MGILLTIYLRVFNDVRRNNYFYPLGTKNSRVKILVVIVWYKHLYYFVICDIYVYNIYIYSYANIHTQIIGIDSHIA